MKKLYTCNTIAAEQFTDECTPDGVIPAPKEFHDLLADFPLEQSESGLYIYKTPYPDDNDELFTKYLDAPCPFSPIEKGDYVVTHKGGYSTVITEKSFRRDYSHIELLSF
jgi:hypothetical protein